MSTAPAFEYLPVVVRAWPDNGTASGPRNSNTGGKYIPYGHIVFDTETTTDPTQRLNFGSAKIVWIRYGNRFYDEPRITDEVMFYADDLPGRYADGYQTLVDYCAEHDLKLVSQTEFIKDYVSQAYHNKGVKTPPRMCLTGFNVPFDVSRIATDHGSSRGNMAGGFTFYMNEDSYRSITIRHLDSKKALMGGAQLLDLRTLVWSMTNKAPSLHGACKLFQLPEDKAKGHAEVHGRITPEYIDYNRQDVTATAHLALAALRLYDQHPVSLSPLKALSPASLAKSYYDSMGITPLIGRPGMPTDPVMLGNVMSGYFGGRAECHIRNTVVPVTVLDYTSMYPTVNANLGLWKYVTAEKIEIRDDTEQVRDFLDRVTLADVLNRENWPRLTAFALVRPQGDVLPVRAAYGANGDSTNVGINQLHSATPLWYALPDLVASKLLTGETPEILRAIVMEPVGKLGSLTPVDLIGTVRISPDREDFFTRVIEQRGMIKTQCVYGQPKNCTCHNCRTQEFLKVLSNSGSYGVFMQITRKDLEKDGLQSVYGAFDSPWEYKGTAFETAGSYCYPPIAALITSSARLMLGILERLVTDAGGTWAFCDTDSMAVVATPDGGENPCTGVTALSHARVEQIRDAVNSLNPYTGPAGKSLLKREADCFAYVISAKRYALFRYDPDTGRPVVPDQINGKSAYMEHGLGLYLNPSDISSPDRDWMRQLWQYIVDHAHGLNPELPAWINRPALTRSTVSSPHLLNVFRDYNAGKDYGGRIKPFSFILLASEYNRTAAIDGDKNRRVVTGYTPDPQQWESADWYDLHDITASPVRVGDGGMRVKTFVEVLDEYMSHPEPKYLGPDGKPCNSRTAGLLGRRTVHVQGITHIGKESNKLEEVEEGQIDDWNDVVTDYGAPSRTELARTVLSMTPASFIADLYNILNVRTWLWKAGTYANGYLGVPGSEIPLAVFNWKPDGGITRKSLITRQTVHKFATGQPVSRATEIQLTKLAAYIVVETTGIPATDVAWTGNTSGRRHTPRSVLAAWNELGRPGPWPWDTTVSEVSQPGARPTRLCYCGCGKPLARPNQLYFKRSCSERMRRARKAAA